ncbi:hypothetical protein GW916_10415 [bacterium]|nr:hypothetical protein [bacterium]
MSMKTDIIAALEYLPQHRKRAGKRAEMIHLDQLIEERRLLHDMRRGHYDLVMMAYRYRNLALLSIQEFLSKKKLKPLELEDLLVLGFATIMSRDNTPGPVLINEFVEASKKSFGKFCGGLCNAYLRKVLREKNVLLAKLKEAPELALPAALQKRWKDIPEVQKILGASLLRRPEKGISGFDKDLTLKRRNLEDWKQSEGFQAMDIGSWELCQWINQTLTSSESFKTNKDFHFLDVCSAPGGKLIALSSLLSKAAQFDKKQNVTSFATDSKFQRLEQLNSNIENWPQLKIKTALKQWGSEDSPQDDLSSILKSTRWNFVLADLPCSGSGTLHTRPDVLEKDLVIEVKKLAKLQESILKEVLKLNFDSLCVSICSVDPEEIEFISKILGVKATFNSLSINSLPMPPSLDWSDEDFVPKEGLVAWWVNANKT